MLIIHQATDRDASSSMNSLAPLIKMLHASHHRNEAKSIKKNLMPMFKKRKHPEKNA